MRNLDGFKDQSQDWDKTLLWPSSSYQTKNHYGVKDLMSFRHRKLSRKRRAGRRTIMRIKRAVKEKLREEKLAG